MLISWGSSTISPEKLYLQLCTGQNQCGLEFTFVWSSLTYDSVTEIYGGKQDILYLTIPTAEFFNENEENDLRS